MKKLLLSIFALLVCGAIWAQQQTYTYQLLESDVSRLASKYIHVDPLVVDVTVGEVSGSSVGVGASSQWGLTNKIWLDGQFSVAYAYFAPGSSIGVHLNAGGTYFLWENTKTDDVPVVLKYEESEINGVRTRVTTFLPIKAPVVRQVGPRAGIFLKNGYQELSGSTDDVPLTTFQGGVYLGGTYLQRSFVKVRLDGEDFNRSGGVMFRAYVDALISPIRIAAHPTIGIPQELQDAGILGWRFGIQWHIRPQFELKPRFFQGLTSTLEIGSRPLDGTYINTTVGFTIYKK